MTLLGSSAAAEEQLLEAERLLDERHISAALGHFDYAEEAGANADRCCAGRWMCHMLAGDFSSAWKESDAIRARGMPDPHRFWNGEEIRDRRLIVRCLHGLGDAVQMLRYAPRLKELCAELIVEVPPALLELATRFDGVDLAITWGERAPVLAPRWDVQVEVTELPYLFRTTVDDLPVAAGYIQLDPGRGPRLPSNPGIARIGVVWAAGDWNPTRSISFAEFRGILITEGVEFWSLQGGVRANDWIPTKTLRDARELGDGIELLARVISKMDLVITVDTLAAHLAGALGRPVWVLLQDDADWRWMLNRCSSPWYPSVRLYRKQHGGEWADLMNLVYRDLELWTAEFMRLRSYTQSA